MEEFIQVQGDTIKPLLTGDDEQINRQATELILRCQHIFAILEILNDGMTKKSYLGEMFFKDNACIVTVGVTRKMDGSFVGKNYTVIMTSVKSCCIVIEITGMRKFDIKEFSEILGSIRIAE